MRRLFGMSIKGIRWPLLACVIAGLLGNGCSGINASHSVSPLDFLLPGLHIQNRPELPAPDGTNSILTIATATVMGQARRGAAFMPLQRTKIGRCSSETEIPRSSRAEAA